MKTVILFSLLSIPLLEVNNQLNHEYKLLPPVTEKQAVKTQPEPAYGKMSAIEFKSQDYCRAELTDFEFDAHFSIVSANVYFSGANFRGVERGTINSSSLKPINALKGRCIPGSVVVFDEIKVKGPDNSVRTIPGVTYKLY